MAAVEILLQRGADINQKQSGNSRATALHIAVAWGRKKVVEILLSCNPNLEVRDGTDLTPLHVAAAAKAPLHGTKRDILLLLLEARADMNAKFRKRWTALIKAIEENDLELCQLLIDYGANIEVTLARGETALHHMAARDEDHEQIAFWLRNHANVEAVDTNGFTPLIVAAENGAVKNMKLLLENGASVTARDRRLGKTALHFAVAVGPVESVSLLLEYGANPIPTGRGEGGHPIMIAEYHKQTEVKQLLLQVWDKYVVAQYNPMRDRQDPQKVEGG
jgi:ankyrin repeat protein